MVDGFAEVLLSLMEGRSHESHHLLQSKDEIIGPPNPTD